MKISTYIVMVLYVPSTENGHMDDSKETTRIDLWKTIAPHKGIDLDSIFYPETVGYVVGRISQGKAACMHVTCGVHGFTGMKAHHCTVYR